MLEQADADRRESELFVRQLAAMEHDPDMALQVLARYEQGCLTEARHKPAGSEQLLDRLLAEESRLAMESRLPWVEYARDQFTALQRKSKDGAART